jgi:hypothetical protein
MKDKEFVVEKIRSQYTEQQHTELDALKALDAKVKKPANVFGYLYGSIGAMVMGAGMSLVLTAYPIYRKILTYRKKKYAAQILELSEKALR